MKKFKTIIISVVFYVVGAAIMWGLFDLCFWLFKSKFWQTFFIFAILLNSIKYFWDHTEWTINKLKE